MKKVFLIVLSIISLTLEFSYSQLVMNNNNGDFIEITEGNTWTESRTISFEGSLTRYNSIILSRGIHFKNRITNVVNNNIVEGSSYNTSSVFGAHGNGSVMKYTGHFRQDEKSGFAQIALFDTGKIVIAKEALIDLINVSYFTRQFWIWSDGTGTFEFEEGFVADCTLAGTQPVGLGSIRLSNCNVITHNSLSIPYGYRPNSLPDGDPAINSHFVFENEEGSVWKVMTNDQVFHGGIWLKTSSVTIETIKNLEIAGRRAKWSDYTNWGGVMFGNACDGLERALYKTGKAKLILSGDYSFEPGSQIVIKEGIVEFKSDPFTNTENAGYDVTYSCTISSPNLAITVEDSTRLIINTPKARIDSIYMSSGATLEIGIFDTLETQKAIYDGNLIITIPSGVTLQAGDTFNIIPSGINAGVFDSIQLSTFGNAITWNTSQLYSTGKIFVESGTVTGDKETPKNIAISFSPNPFVNEIYCRQAQPGHYHLLITKLTGIPVFSGSINTPLSVIPTQDFISGIYLYQVKNAAGQIVQSGTFIKQ